MNPYKYKLQLMNRNMTTLYNDLYSSCCHFHFSYDLSCHEKFKYVCK